MNTATATAKPQTGARIAAYLTDEQREVVTTLGQKLGKSDSVLVREALQLLAQKHGATWPQRIRVI